MKLLFTGTNDALDWTRRKILTAAGYNLVSARDSKSLSSLNLSDTQLGLLSNLIPPNERQEIVSLIRDRWPDMLLLSFSSSPIESRATVPALASPSEVLKIVGGLDGAAPPCGAPQSILYVCGSVSPLHTCQR